MSGVCAQQAPPPLASDAMASMLETANLMARHGVPPTVIDAWVEKQAPHMPGVRVTPATPQPAPPKWQAYAYALWQSQQADPASAASGAAVHDAYAQASVRETAAPPVALTACAAGFDATGECEPRR